MLLPSFLNINNPANCSSSNIWIRLSLVGLVFEVVFITRSINDTDPSNGRESNWLTTFRHWIGAVKYLETISWTAGLFGLPSVSCTTSSGSGSLWTVCKGVNAENGAAEMTVAVSVSEITVVKDSVRKLSLNRVCDCVELGLIIISSVSSLNISSADSILPLPLPKKVN